MKVRKNTATQKITSKASKDIALSHIKSAIDVLGKHTLTTNDSTSRTAIADLGVILLDLKSNLK